MEPVVFNYDTGELVRGEIKRPPIEFLAEMVFAPAFKQWLREQKRKNDSSSELA